MRRLYHFLGSLSFALILLVILSLFVFVGTLVEAKTASHQYAMQTVYRHPLFTLFLFFAFLNILLAALRRFPFRWKHLPFLTTHLGLLFLIGGVMAKNVWGLQGYMLIWEGEESCRLLFPDSYAVHLQDRTGTRACLGLPKMQLKNHTFENLSVQVVRFFPDSCCETLSWIDGDWLHLKGMLPIPVVCWEEATAIPPGAPYLHTPWNVLAVKTDTPWQTAQTIYESQLTGKWGEGQLPLHFSDGQAQSQDFCCHIDLEKQVLQTFWIGEKAVLPLGLYASQPFPSPVRVTLSRPPLLLWVQDAQTKQIIFFAFDAFGRIFWEPWSPAKDIVCYDRGFGGYAYLWSLPFFVNPISPEDIGQAVHSIVVETLQRVVQQDTPLSPPLEKLARICQEIQLDWKEVFVYFLEEWHKSGKQLLDGQEELLYPEVWQALAASYALTAEPALSVVSQYFFSYSLDPSLLDPSLFQQEITDLLGEKREDSLLILETPLVRRYHPQVPRKKVEERTPAVVLRVSEGTVSQFITLPYDPLERDLWWPILHGKYLLCFRANQQIIPHSIRIREANEVRYPGTAQAWGYQAEGHVSHRGKERDLLLSMNRVYQTPNGYRFYLSHLEHSLESGIDCVRLIVNYDPFKYWITYPGAVILTLGVFALLFGRRYGKKE